MGVEIGEFGVGRPDFGGRRPRGDALGQKKNRIAGLGLELHDCIACNAPEVAKSASALRDRDEHGVRVAGGRLDLPVRGA